MTTLMTISGRKCPSSWPTISIRSWRVGKPAGMEFIHPYLRSFKACFFAGETYLRSATTIENPASVIATWKPITHLSQLMSFFNSVLTASKSVLTRFRSDLVASSPWPSRITFAMASACSGFKPAPCSSLDAASVSNTVVLMPTMIAH